jgi:hypothetical protein
MAQMNGSIDKVSLIVDVACTPPTMSNYAIGHV